jgi:hypothetical protein
VHQNSLTTGVAGDLTKPWRDSHDAEIVWTTFDTDPLQDRLFREASLDRTDFGVGFLVNSRATPNVAPLLQPLDDYRAKTPIEDFGDIAPGLVSAMTIGGKLIAIPFRTATIGLFYNEALLEEKGIKAPPATLEELVDQCIQKGVRSIHSFTAGLSETGDPELALQQVRMDIGGAREQVAGRLLCLPDDCLRGILGFGQPSSRREIETPMPPPSRQRPRQGNQFRLPTDCSGSIAPGEQADRVDGLRVRDVRGLGERSPERRLGQAPRSCGRRCARDSQALELTPGSAPSSRGLGDNEPVCPAMSGITFTR